MTQDPDAPAADERQTLGEEIIAWIETNCRVPEGALIGQQIQLMDWPEDTFCYRSRYIFCHDKLTNRRSIQP